jgi:hypothetical protein
MAAIFALLRAAATGFASFSPPELGLTRVRRFGLVEVG